MNPFLPYVEKLRSEFQSARKLSVTSSAPAVIAPAKVLIFSPHPDDESIIGLLPLRLMRERNMQIINVPVTHGSNPDRRPGRAEELAKACAFLGWHNLGGKDGVQDLEEDDICRILLNIRPEVVFMPHAADWNSRHVSTHKLVVSALSRMPDDFACKVVETEYWGNMDDPNLMVEGDTCAVADLVAATSLHVGEVARNPYHLSLPFWMMDNVRRGSELVGGQGTSAPDFTFATLYRLRHFRHGNLVPCLNHGLHLPCGSEHLNQLF